MLETIPKAAQAAKLVLAWTVNEALGCCLLFRLKGVKENMWRHLENPAKKAYTNYIVCVYSIRFERKADGRVAGGFPAYQDLSKHKTQPLISSSSGG